MTTPPWGNPPPLILLAAIRTRINGVTRTRTVLTTAAPAKEVTPK